MSNLVGANFAVDQDGNEINEVDITITNDDTVPTYQLPTQFLSLLRIIRVTCFCKLHMNIVWRHQASFNVVTA